MMVLVFSDQIVIKVDRDVQIIVIVVVDQVVVGYLLDQIVDVISVVKDIIFIAVVVQTIKI